MNFNRLKTTGTTVVKTTQLHEFYFIFLIFFTLALYCGTRRAQVTLTFSEFIIRILDVKQSNALLIQQMNMPSALTRLD